MSTDWLLLMLLLIPPFCFGYPFVMAWYWMAGGIFYWLISERRCAPLESPPQLDHWPAISILVPCHNEEANGRETLAAACAVDYPDFEVIAINDGSRDGTAALLDSLACEFGPLRVVHLAENGGKAMALNVGAMLARHEILLCIDGDALLDPRALKWAAFYLQRNDLGAITGNPRIRNRSTVLGRLQVGEFSSIIGLIKRAQSAYGRLFTVSGVICVFRRRALADAGWWSSHTLTDDIDITWRIQIAGWNVKYAPNVLVWILMPETLRGLWSQRLRWAEGGVQMMLDYFKPMVFGQVPTLLPIYINFLLSVLWSYCIIFGLFLGAAQALGFGHQDLVRGFGLVPEWWGMTLCLTYLLQATISHLLERRFEQDMMKSLFWVIWYPLVFWLLTTLTTIVAVPRVLFLGKGKSKGTWVSPDRGLR